MRPGRPPDDDLAIFDEVPTRTFELRPQAIRPGNRRGSLIAGAWAGALAVFAGVGLLSGGSGPIPSVPRADAAPQGDAALQASPVPRADPAASHLAFDALAGYPPAGYPGARRPEPWSLVNDIVALDAPAPARVEVTTPAVEVRGSVLVRAKRINVALEARGNRLLEQVSIDVADPHGGIRPERAPTFNASFDLPYPRPNGTMWIVVTVYDEAGIPLGGTRRPFAVGPLLAPGTAEGVAEDTSAADAVPLPDQPDPVTGALPTCLPRSPTHSSTC